MTITLELGPEELAVLSERAQAQGVDIQAVLHGLIAQLAPPPQKQAAAFALRQSWRQEDALDDPEERAERERELAEFQANIARWRAEEGEK